MTAPAVSAPVPRAGAGLTRLLRARETGTLALVLLVFVLATIKDTASPAGTAFSSCSWERR
jgi:hypothetical protein